MSQTTSKRTEHSLLKVPQELQDRNALLQTIFDTVKEGIFVLEPLFNSKRVLYDFSYVKVNRVVNKYYKQQEMTGRSFLKANPFAVEKGIFKKFKETMLHAQPAEFEVEFDNNTSTSWFTITARKHNELLICTLQNITAEKRRTQKLKESILFKKRLLETSPDIIIITDVLEKRIKYSNHTDLLPNKRLPKMTFLDTLHLVHPQDRQKLIDLHSEILETDNKNVLEREIRLLDEHSRWAYYNCRGKIFRRNKTAAVTECILLLQNIQGQKIAQQALIKAEKLSIKGEIARNLAHELRNPLAAISMSTEILRTKLKSSEKDDLEKFLSIIKNGTATLNKLVTDLITASNYSSPKLKKCGLANLLNNVLGQVEDRLFLAGTRVIKKYGSSQYIWADKERLSMAFLNLIVNACEAMDGQKGVLTVKINRRKEECIVTISDNGCGMKPHELEHLFESFYTSKDNGMGIGLSSVKNILDEHKATVKVESTPQQGTTFKIYFPVYKLVE